MSEPFSRDNIAKFLTILSPEVQKFCFYTKKKIVDENADFNTSIKILEKWKEDTTNAISKRSQEIFGIEIDLEKVIPEWNEEYEEDDDVAGKIEKLQKNMEEWKEFIRQQVSKSPLIVNDDINAISKNEN